MQRAALISDCGLYRWALVRRWDGRPMLLVVGFNPSTADAHRDDPTINTLRWRASRWGFGGIVVVNLIPLRSSSPGNAVLMVKRADLGNGELCDRLVQNRSVIVRELRQCSAILLAYGALGDRVASLTESVIEEVKAAAGDRPLYCIGRTASGAPIHPQARGKHRPPADAPLIPWKVAA
ncbi:MAG: DUF1643 domain-containing protein [Sinimarinibacterium flocculans]|uniref:DUF1643 domain-containing protein n=1 Tax=Sinimarinibacterium flocculans TaxID=985250 RepID=UPI003C57CDAD